MAVSETARSPVSPEIEEGVAHPEEELGLRALAGELLGGEGEGQGEDKKGHQEEEPPLPEVHPVLPGQKAAQKPDAPHPQKGQTCQEEKAQLVRVEDHPFHQLGVVF